MNNDWEHMDTIELDEEVTVTGGASAPMPQQLQAPQLQAPVKPVPALPPPPKPFTVPGMAPPKYSAGWWDIVRARGLAK